MSPSQIVKSAYAAARKEGYSHSIKIFARDLAGMSGHVNLNNACKSWLAMKVAQRKQARQRSRGFDGVPVFVREGGRS